MEKFTYGIKTPEELHEILVNKGLEMDISKEEIVHFLTHHSYFQFMLYFRKYWDEKHNFLPGTKFSIVRDTYIFDQRLRLLLFYYMSEIENSFKNIFCQTTCQLHNNVRWTDKNNFRNTRIFDDVLQPIIKEIDDKIVKNDYLKRYINKYDDPKYPPFWNMLEVLSFGQISLMYKSLDNSIKKTVAGNYNIDNSILENRLQCIVTTRNICCHHNKLCDRQDLFEIKIPKKFQGKDIFEGHERDLSGILSIIYYMLKFLKLDEKLLYELKILLAEYHYIPEIIRKDREEKLRLLK